MSRNVKYIVTINNITNPRVSIIFLIMLVLFSGLSGCSSSIPELESPSEFHDPMDNISIDNEINSDSFWVDLPLAKYAEIIRRFTVEDHSENDESNKVRFDNIQTSIAECMKERGFTYFPDSWRAHESFPGFFPEGDQVDLPKLPQSREEVAKVGYGVRPPWPLPTKSDAPQRNAAYRDSLSPNSRAAYDLAFNGPDPYSPPSASPSKTCPGLAAERFPLLEQKISQDEKDLFRDYYQDLVLDMNDLLLVGVVEDPVTVQLNAEWNECMASRGYDLNSGSKVAVKIVNPWAAWTMALRMLPDGTLGETWNTYVAEQRTPDEQRSLLGTEAERRIALDDFDCREKVNYMQRYIDVQIAMENDFLDRYSRQLSEMVAFADQYG